MEKFIRIKHYIVFFFNLRSFELWLPGSENGPVEERGLWIKVNHRNKFKNKMQEKNPIFYKYTAYGYVTILFIIINVVASYTCNKSMLKFKRT